MRIEAFRWRARMERRVSCFRRDDGVDGVHDLWEHFRYSFFVAILRTRKSPTTA